MFVKIITWINIGCGALFFLCYALQLFYTLLTCVKKPKTFAPAPKTKRYALLICARNEESVIGSLLDSALAQDYPAELLDCYVAADNCSDGTAKTAREKGATVYERKDPERIGKGYALQFLLENVTREKGDSYYDAYIIVDADNLLDRQYVSKMNDCFSEGHRIITSYRNSKNYGDNWIAAGSALWFLREARQLNAARFLLGTSCSVSGTGFLVSSELIREQGGWKHFLIIEDIEFSIDSILRGEKIAYCHDAILYDEQPTKFRQSWRQHVRWSRGYLQVLRRYGLKMLKGIFTGPHLACYDMIMTICPAYFLTLVGFVANLALLGYVAFTGGNAEFWSSFAKVLSEMYIMTYAVGIVATVTEWKRICCSTAKKLLYPFVFPLFMLLYLPEAVAALFTRPRWKPIAHTVCVDLDEIEKSNPSASKKKKEEPSPSVKSGDPTPQK